MRARNRSSSCGISRSRSSRAKSGTRHRRRCCWWKRTCGAAHDGVPIRPLNERLARTRALGSLAKNFPFVAQKRIPSRRYGHGNAVFGPYSVWQFNCQFQRTVELRRLVFSRADGNRVGQGGGVALSAPRKSQACKRVAFYGRGVTQGRAGETRHSRPTSLRIRLIPGSIEPALHQSAG
jgi:hypothetical protein